MRKNATCRADGSSPHRSSMRGRIGAAVGTLAAAVLVGTSPAPLAADSANWGLPTAGSRLSIGGGAAAQTLPLAIADAAVRPRPPAPRQNLSAGQLLVASRQLPDPSFARSVILLIQYGAKGAVGVMVNRPTDVKVSSALPDIEALKDRGDLLFFGGPVAVNRLVMIVRAENEPPEALHLFDDVYASGSMKTLRHVLGGRTRERDVRLCAGYAGWAPGQLDAEIARGDWLVAPADAAAVFTAQPAELWKSLIARVEGRWARRGSADSAAGPPA